MNVNNTFLVFAFFIILSFSFAIYGRIKSKKGKEEDVANRSLNKWLIGLSSGATGNSGFVVTGAVGLGYLGGLEAIWLPIAWLLGDIVYWSVFPDKLNNLARKNKSITISGYLSSGLEDNSTKRILVFIIALILVILMTAYMSAQWLAGRKFLGSIFEFSDKSALLFFSTTIIAYSAIGGFRGSVLVDTCQAIIRIIGTILAISVIGWTAYKMGGQFFINLPELNTSNNEFLNPFSIMYSFSFISFIFGFGFAAIGFDLGQPQLVSRYFACSSPEETKKARWIYIGFLQFTWLSMTIFGVILRGVIPEIDDPEKGLGLFFQENFNAVIAGIIFADVYATIAATSNSILISVSQIIKRDILNLFLKNNDSKTPFYIVLIIGFISVLISLKFSGSSVFSIAITAASIIGGVIAGPMIIKTLQWNHNSFSLLTAIVISGISVYLWIYFGLNSYFNEAGIGIIVGLIVNSLIVKIQKLPY